MLTNKLKDKDGALNLQRNEWLEIEVNPDSHPWLVAYTPLAIKAGGENTMLLQDKICFLTA